MRIVFFLLGMLICIAPSFCQELNKAVIAFDTTTFNFGQINKGDNAECTFTFRNAGKVPLIISEVKASCGCTVPVWTKEPVKYQGIGYVKVRYNTSTTGVFNKTITVYSNGSNQAITLTLKGEVKKKK